MRIKELLFDVKEPTVYCESFVYEPSNVEEEKLGHLFMIGRIRNVEESSFYLINLLASRIKREYYNSSHHSPSEAFEAALQQANKVLKSNEERINWLGNLDFFIACITSKRIYFTLLGKIKTFILRGNEVIDLTKDLITEKDIFFPFSVVLQSSLKKDDILIFSTSNIFSKEKLLTIGKNLFPIEEEKIKKFIETNESGVAFIIEMDKNGQVIERLESSMSEKKSNFKIPSFSPESKEKVSQNFKTTTQKIKDFFKTAGQKIKEGISKIPPFFKKLQKKEEEPKKEIPAIRLERVSPKKENINWGNFKKNISKKPVLISLCILIIALLGVGIFQQQKNTIEKNTSKEIIQAVEMKKTEAENIFIYGDKEKALETFSEAFDLINTITPSSQEEKNQVESLKKELEKKISELTGKKILTDISPLFTLKEGVEKWNPEGILASGNNIYIFSNISGLVYKWNLQKKEGTFFQLIDTKGVLDATIIENKPIFFLKEGNIGTEDGKIFKISFPSGITLQDFTELDLDRFQNNFYLFNKKNGEIIKYSFSETGAGKGILWFKEREAGKGATAITIDGSIYLLQKDGSIKRFASGSLKETINAPKVYPKIKNATKIFTSPLNKYIYILEPDEKRIIIIDKKGNLIGEYQSSEFENLKDIWITSQDKKIYVLCGNKTTTNNDNTINTRLFEIDLSK